MEKTTFASISSPPRKAGRREWIGLAVLALPTLLVSMDMTVMYLAVPAISESLKPGSSELLWITDIYGFLQAGLLITMGTLGDHIGRRKLLLYGGTAFTMASALAAFSTSTEMLIGARALLGIAGATLLPSTLSLIRNMFQDDAERTLSMGIWTTCFSAGTMLGPLVGGLLLNDFWWGSVFLMAVPIMILLLILAPLFLPEYRNQNKEYFDIPGAALLTVATLSVIYGIKQLAEHGITWPALLAMLTGIVMGIVFVRRQKTLSHPLIDLSFFQSRVFNTTLSTLMMALFSWAGIYLFVAQYLQLVLDMTPFIAGLWTIPGAAGSIVCCMLAPLAVQYVRRGYLISIGVALMALGIALLMLVDTASLPTLITATVLMAGGCGLTVMLGSDLLISSAPAEKAGTAAGIYETSTNFGCAIGIAILGSILTYLYQGTMMPAIPEGISQEAAKAASSTLGGALTVAGRLNNETGSTLITTAREALVHAMHLAAGICTVILAITSILAAVMLKGVGKTVKQ